MKTFYIIFLIYFFTVCNSFSQQYSPEWAVTYNEYESSLDYSTKMVVDSAGNIYVTGKSWAYDTEFDYLTVKYNTSGVIQWQARYNGTGNYTDEPTAIVVDKSGNVYVTGFSYGGTSDYDYATVKYNSNGVQQWVDRYNGQADSTDNANSIALDVSGNILVTGESRKIGTGGNTNSFVCVTIKYNSAGIRLWTKSYEYLPNGMDYLGKFIKCDALGNSYIGEGRSWVILKYNEYGVLQWTVLGSFVPGSVVGGYLTSFEIDLNRNIYISGFTSESLYDSSITFKYNASGIMQWRVTTSNFNPKSIAVDSSGNLYSSGESGYHGQKDFVTLKYNSSGILQWQQRYRAVGYLYFSFYGIGLSLDVSGNVYVTGNGTYNSTGYDFVTLKYNSSGIKQWVSRYYWIANSYEDLPASVKTDYKGNVYVSGYTLVPGTEYDYLTLKYPSSLQLNATILMEGFYNENTNRINRKDTLTAYLRNISFPYAIIDSGKAVIDTLNFRCGFCFNNAPAGTYYIAIKHRNSIETWSKTGGESFSKSSPVYYDFTASASQAFGSNLVLKGSRYCIFSGNINQDGIIDASDQSQVDNDSFSGLSGSFLSSDVNGDNFVDATDVGIVDNNRSVVINRPFF